MAKRLPAVAFRPTEQDLAWLQKQGKRRGLTVGQFLKEYVTEGRLNTERARFEAEIDMLQRELLSLKAAHAEMESRMEGFDVWADGMEQRKDELQVSVQNIQTKVKKIEKALESTLVGV